MNKFEKIGLVEWLKDCKKNNISYDDMIIEVQELISDE
jgi:hypothetical protein